MHALQIKNEDTWKCTGMEMETEIEMKTNRTLDWTAGLTQTTVPFSV